MACIDPHGHLTETARTVLAAFEHPRTAEEVSTVLNLPLFRIRSAIREMAEAGLLAEESGSFVATLSGLELLSSAKLA